MRAVGVTVHYPSGKPVHLEPQIFGPDTCGEGRWAWVLTISSGNSYWPSSLAYLMVNSEEEAIIEVTRQLNALVKALGLEYIGG